MIRLGSMSGLTKAPFIGGRRNFWTSSLADRRKDSLGLGLGLGLYPEGLGLGALRRFLYERRLHLDPFDGHDGKLGFSSDLILF